MSKKPNNALRLALWVTAAFLILIGAWSTLITIANKNAPEKIELAE